MRPQHTNAQALLNVAVELVLAICHAKPTFPAMTEMMGRTHLTLYQWDASLMWEFHLPSVSEALCVAGHQAVLQKISFMRCKPAVVLGRPAAESQQASCRPLLLGCASPSTRAHIGGPAVWHDAASAGLAIRPVCCT